MCQAQPPCARWHLIEPLPVVLPTAWSTVPPPDLQYSVHRIDLGKGEQKEDWYLKINPNGRIPAIGKHGRGPGRGGWEGRTRLSLQGPPSRSRLHEPALEGILHGLSNRTGRGVNLATGQGVDRATRRGSTQLCCGAAAPWRRRQADPPSQARPVNSQWTTKPATCRCLRAAPC